MIQSLKRAADILNCFKTSKKLGVTQLSKQVGLNKSTTYGLINTLTELGYLEQTNDGMYQLGIELLRLGNKVYPDDRKVIGKELDKLANDLEETINYVKRKGTNVVYVAKRESQQPMRVSTTIGMELPLYCTAVGRAIMAYMPESEIDDVLNTSDMISFTENTVTNIKKLKEILSEIKKQGYAVEAGEWNKELTCVAVPLLDEDGQATRAISCTGPAVRMTNERIKICRDKLRESAKCINEKN